MRFVCLATAAVAACGGGGDHGDDGSNSLPAAECATDGDCLLAGASCCSCPSYAAPANNAAITGCNGVSCPLNECSNNVQPGCVAGSCQMECLPLYCPTGTGSDGCQYGFALAPDGCLTCDCAGPGDCQTDDDCAEVSADCCGCERGGSDTAVGSDDVGNHQAGLQCSANLQCPGIDACDPDAQVRCFATNCYLVPGVDVTFPPNAFLCGRAGLAACPGDTFCTINALAAANAQGVGICN
jgi:hypothetical protein